MLSPQPSTATAVDAGSEVTRRCLKVVVAHNHYQQAGGEDRVFSSEVGLLRANGHEVEEYAVHNEAVNGIGRLELARSASWNDESYRRLLDLFQSARPDVVHVHNTLPLISPSIYYAARRAGAAVVQTLHNFRMFCPAAFLYRKNAVCEKCLGRTFAWPGIVHGCYRGSRTATAASAISSGLHRIAGTYSRKVNRYIALTEFGAAKARQGGLPAGKIRVKPNFLSADPGLGDGAGGYALFVGRLSGEKGVETLLRAFEAAPGVRLVVAGTGPEEEKVSAAAKRCPWIEWVGQRSHQEVLSLMKSARMLVFPSEWYETFGLVAVEAFAVGLPVVASRLGAMESIITHGSNGLHFTPGDADSLRRQVEWAARHDREMERMRRNARREFEARYTAEPNYALLMEIYAEAIADAGTKPRRAAGT